MTRVLCTFLLALLFIPTAHARGAEDDVRALIKSYETSLNAGDADVIAGLYAQDAVFMPQHFGPVEGNEAIHASYKQILGMISLDIEFVIDELHVRGKWAWARTRSAGTTTILANGAEVSEGNQEIFIFEKVGKEWLIARYIFSTTNPPPAAPNAAPDATDASGGEDQ
jgi:uncharacterized protein (TIGR02246 family)